MSSKNDIEVRIGGKVFTLSGYESEDYLKEVASYLDQKYLEYQGIEAFRKYPTETQNILINLNIADDFFKSKNKIEQLEEEIRNKENELYDLKHELIATQIKLENTEKTLKTTQDEISRNTKEMNRMETELKGFQNKNFQTV